MFTRMFSGSLRRAAAASTLATRLPVARRFVYGTGAAIAIAAFAQSTATTSARAESDTKSKTSKPAAAAAANSTPAAKAAAAPASPPPPAAAAPVDSSSVGLDDEEDEDDDSDRFSPEDLEILLTAFPFTPAPASDDDQPWGKATEYELRVRSLLAMKYFCPCLADDMKGPCADENFRFMSCIMAAKKCCTPAERKAIRGIKRKLAAAKAHVAASAAAATAGTPPPPPLDPAMWQLTAEEERVHAQSPNCVDLMNYSAFINCRALADALEACQLKHGINQKPGATDSTAPPPAAKATNDKPAASQSAKH